MSVKPHIALLFLLTVLTILWVIAIIFPEEGIVIGGKKILQFATAEEIFNPSATEYADISDILEDNAQLTDSIVELISLVTEEEVWDTIRANADSLRRSISRIEFPDNNRSMLYPAFQAFETATASNQVVRIMHYGDSQIEGDRITSFIRNRLQKKFGGMGSGLVPVEQVYDFSFSVLQETSQNWYRYTLYGNRDTTLDHKRYGALASFCRFAPQSPDSVSEAEGSPYEAWISFAPSGYSYPNTKQFQQIRVFYSHNTAPFVAELHQGEQLTDADFYPPSSSLQTIRWSFDTPVNEARIVFRGESSPDIYGIALDGLSGIAVDNIPMRGNSGLFFTKMDRELLQAHLKALNVKMVFMQFGGNVVPHVTESYAYYENLFYYQLRRLRQILPEVAIIVIGVADMSVKDKNRYVSYPNIVKVRNALKSASFRANAAYWDVYKAMGGENSMPSWVFANPPLASKDFVHFNPRGARIIANMFYNALLYEYTIYKQTAEARDESSL